MSNKEDNMRHIARVRDLLNVFIRQLMRRGELHDQSKLVSPEAELFEEVGAKLSKLDYGTPEYAASLVELKPALEHHYAHNRHHPEHFKNGIDDMNLIDLVEWFADCKASAERQKGGNLHHSITVAAKRFNLTPQLVRILENTVAVLEPENGH